MAYESMDTLKPQNFPPAAPLSAYRPMGNPANSPEANLRPQPNVVPQNQARTSPTPTTSFPGAIGKAYDMSQQETPEVTEARKNLQDFKIQQSQAVAGVKNHPRPLYAGQGRLQILNSQYSEQLPAYEQAVSNALSSQGQRLGALGQVVNASAPQQVSPGNFYVNPQTGQDVSGGSINPGSGGARMTQVAQGQQAQLNVPLINTAAGFTNDFNRTLSTSGLLDSDVNVQNLLKNIYASNTSNPNYPKLQAQFNNAINMYAQILGQDPTQLISNLASTSQGSTVSAVLGDLDRQARSYNQNLLDSSQSQNPTSTTVQPMPQPHAPGSVVPGQGQYQGMQFRVEANGGYTRIK